MALLLSNAGWSSEKPLRYEKPALWTGTVYAGKGGSRQVLYKFKRTATRSGNSVKAVREYTYPDGRPAARELTVYEGNNLVSYELEELQINARGIARIQSSTNNPDRISFTYVSDLKTPHKAKQNTEKLQPDTVVNDMLAPFLAAHWSELMRGEEVKCRYIAVTRAETVGFKFTKHAESTRDGKPVVIIKMSPTSLIIAALVDPLYFTMEKDGDHRVLQYDGRTTPKLQDRTKWKDLDAVTVFESN